MQGEYHEEWYTSTSSIFTGTSLNTLGIYLHFAQFNCYDLSDHY